MKKIQYFLIITHLLLSPIIGSADELESGFSEDITSSTYIDSTSEPSTSQDGSSSSSDSVSSTSSSSTSSSGVSSSQESSSSSSPSDSHPSSKLGDNPSPEEKEREAGLEAKDKDKKDKDKKEEEQEFTVSVNYTTQSFIKMIGEDSRAIGQEYKIYASVMIAQAILESGSGNSGLSQAPNYNLFGIKGEYEGKSISLSTQEDDGTGKLYTIKADFRKYPNYKASLSDYAKLIRTDLYSNVWKENAPSYQDATKALTGKYATDTSYNKKLNALIEAYDLTRYDSETDQSLLERYPDGDYPDYNGLDYPGSEQYTETSARYAFNRMTQLGGKLETNFGDPLNWANAASQQDYQVNQEPKVGTVAVFQPKQEKAGKLGLVAIVEKVYPSGAILISEYGKFSEKLVSYRVVDSENAKAVQYISPKSLKE